MVGPSGTEAVSPPRPARIPPSSGFALNPSAFEASTSSGAGVSGALGAPIALQLPYPARAEHDDYRPATPTDRTSGSTTGTSRSSRSNSFDLGPTSSSPSATVTAKSTTVLRVRPALRLNSNGGPQIVSVGSSPQRRGPTAAAVTPSTAATTPLSGLSDASQLWKSAPQLVQPSPQPSRLQPSAPSNNEVPVLPDLNLRRADSYDLSRIPEWAPLSPKPKPQATVSGPPSPPRKDVLVPQSSPRPKSRNKEHHRTHSQKTMLASALQKANTAVTLDNAENYEGAMEAYSDACVLLSQVMQRAGGEDDKKKLQTIKETYMLRIAELQALPPRNTTNERELPPRPLTEEFTDEASMFTVDDDESTLGPAKSSTGEVEAGDASTIPPRRDSLYISHDGTLATGSAPPLPARSTPPGLSQNPTSALPRPVSPPSPQPDMTTVLEESPVKLQGFHRMSNNRESFTFGAAALSPKYSLRKELDYGIRRRSGSDASSNSSRSLHQSQSHSREPSEASTSWLNTIDESGSSASGEFSPDWLRKHPAQQGSRLDSIEQEADVHVQGLPMFDDDFDTQLDAAVEAAYDDGYEVDYSYDREEEIMMMKSPRLNVERAKERVRQVEREMELEIQKERKRRLEREQLDLFNGPQSATELAFYDDGDDDDESEEERMLEEMTRGYTLDDFDFNLDTKTALPRESASTTYSDLTFIRGSASSGFSGTTWGSSASGNFVSSTSLTTVAEAPSTPPPLPPTSAASPAKQQDIDEHTSPKTLPNTPSKLSPGGLTLSKPSGVRSRRLSALSETLEPLKIETAASPGLAANSTSIPTTVLRGPSPNVEIQPPSAPAQQPPPIPTVPPPLNIPPRSTSAAASRPSTSNGQQDNTPQSPEIAGDKDPSSPPPPEPSHGGLTAIPLTKAISDDGVSGSRSGSPAKFAPRIPGLRQIQSSASLRSRNVMSPETEPPGTPVNNLFASSSTSNLRKPYSRSITPATPGLASSIAPPPTAGLPTSGMNLFDNKIHSPETPSGNSTDLLNSTPNPLEPCPAEPLSKPYWLMRSLYQTIAHPRGGYISTQLFVPREVWAIKGVKIKSVDDKISACDLVTAALMKLSTVNQEDVNAVYEEMQALEGVLDRAQTLLAKKLGSDVGGPGAKALYGINDNSLPDGVSDMVTTKVGSVGGSKSYFSLRKLRTKASSNALGSTFTSTNTSNGDFQTNNSLPMAMGTTTPSQQAKRNLESVTFTGPHASYTSALARLFDSAQILDRLTVFDEDALPKKINGMTKIGLELSQRHAAEFFGLYICRFVLTDIGLLLDKFVKRGSEWVAQ